MNCETFELKNVNLLSIIYIFFLDLFRFLFSPDLINQLKKTRAVDTFIGIIIIIFFPLSLHSLNELFFLAKNRLIFCFVVAFLDIYLLIADFIYGC